MNNIWNTKYNGLNKEIKDKNTSLIMLILKKYNKNM